MWRDVQQSNPCPAGCAVWRIVESRHIVLHLNVAERGGSMVHVAALLHLIVAEHGGCIVHCARCVSWHVMLHLIVVEHGGCIVHCTRCVSWHVMLQLMVAEFGTLREATQNHCWPWLFQMQCSFCAEGQASCKQLGAPFSTCV